MNRYSYVTGSYHKMPYIEKVIHTVSIEPPEITIRQMFDDFEQRHLDQVRSNIDEYIDNINRSQFEDNNG
jgi:phage terminase Nu1 subunit (DNA packaging protein)